MGVCASTRGACRGRHEDDGGGDDGSPRHGGGAKTPLHDAVEAGDGAAVKRLLKEREVDQDARDELGNTALIYAAFEGRRAIVALLLFAGADKNKPGNRGDTPLTMASAWGHEAVVAMLLTEGAVSDRRARV